MLTDLNKTGPLEPEADTSPKYLPGAIATRILGRLEHEESDSQEFSDHGDFSAHHEFTSGPF